MLLPTPLVAVVLVKVVAHWMMSGLPLLIVSPLAALLLGMSLHDAGVLALTLLLGTPTLSFLGAAGVGLTVGLKRGGVLLSLLGAAAGGAAADLRPRPARRPPPGSRSAASLAMLAVSVSRQRHPVSVRHLPPRCG